MPRYGLGDVRVKRGYRLRRQAWISSSRAAAGFRSLVPHRLAFPFVWENNPPAQEPMNFISEHGDYPAPPRLFPYERSSFLPA